VTAVIMSMGLALGGGGAGDEQQREREKPQHARLAHGTSRTKWERPSYVA
jgi:hypothetical protein